MRRQNLLCLLGSWLPTASLALFTAGCGQAPLGSPDSGVDGGDSLTSNPGDLPRFSFFVASLKAMQRLSGSQSGFGGDLRFGQADGLAGADEICRQVAESSLPGSGAKGWRAFLSATRGRDGNPVHAVDRVGEGPWYDRLGRVVALGKADLAQTRPRGADALVVDDLPNEDGVPNQTPDGVRVDNHHILTGSDPTGRLYRSDWSVTCHDWTSSVGGDGKPRVGLSWPRGAGGPGPGGGGVPRPGPDGGARPGGGPGGADNWISALDESGCAAGVSLAQAGGPDPRNPTVGSGGGYGGIYCFALVP